MKAPRRFDTARLMLISPSEDDSVEVFQRYASDPEVTRFLGWPRHDVGVRHLSALCHPQNLASWRVLEKCGFGRDNNWTGQTEFPNLAPGVHHPALRYVLVLHGHCS